MEPFRITALLLALAPLAACSTNVTYEDPDEVEILSTDFSYSDLKQIAQDLTDSFLSSNAWGGDVPRIVMGGVANRTNQHIDTVNITDTIRTALIQSGKFSVLAGVGDAGLSEIDKDLGYQKSGAVDQATAVEIGKQLGAEYVFYGRFTTLQARHDDVESIYYKFTLNAVNVTTRQIVWADEKDLRKRKDKTFLGW
ncbi:MAG: penicillin-binding protein activator LpoB [Planctomycetota bacterium]|nr:penicillin-binding protein activator LpoB [Planctomycetota bacterium]